MSRNFSIYSLLALIFITLSMFSSFTNADVQCSGVISKVMPCLGYLMNRDSFPSVACCSRAQALDKEAAASQPDRQAICRCLKAAAQAFPAINLDKAAKLPTLCKLTTNIPIDPRVDCSRI